MFEKFKIMKYIELISKEFKKDDFTDLFLDSDVLGYSDSKFGKETYNNLEKILGNVYNMIKTNSEYSLLIKDTDGYLIPYTLGWVKLHVINNSPRGVTLYFNNKAYKMYVNNHLKTVNLNVLDIKEPRFSKVIEKNLNYIL